MRAAIIYPISKGVSVCQTAEQLLACFIFRKSSIYREDLWGLVTIDPLVLFGNLLTPSLRVLVFATQEFSFFFYSYSFVEFLKAMTAISERAQFTADKIFIYYISIALIERKEVAT